MSIPSPESMGQEWKLADYYLTLKESYEKSPTPALKKDIINTRNSILTNYGPDFLAEIDPHELTFYEHLMMDSLDGQKPD